MARRNRAKHDPLAESLLGDYRAPAVGGVARVGALVQGDLFGD